MELKNEHRARGHEAAEQLRTLRATDTSNERERREGALRQALIAQKEALLKASHDGAIDPEVVERLNHALNEELVELAQHEEA